MYSSYELIRTLSGRSISGLARVVKEDLLDQLVLALLELINDGVVEGILVLLKPSSDVVADLVYKDLYELYVKFDRL